MSMSYAYDEVLSSTVDYFQGDTLAAEVWADKYCLRNPDEGVYLEKTPEEMHWRLASEFARIEAKYDNPMSKEEIFDLFDRFRFVVPQGSPMSGIGNPYQLQSLSNCFVVPNPVDSYAGILRTDQQFAQIMKRRGGVGVDVSTLRPSGAPTSNAARTSTGLGTFMERYSNTTREVGQDGRRGAAMISCSVHHPDIGTFIGIKNEMKECRQCGHEERHKVTGANVSVRYTDEFLSAVDKGEDYEQRFPVDSDSPSLSQRVSAQTIWDAVIDNAWKSAEPGALFWDQILRRSPADIYAKFGYRTISTNPCAELALSAKDSCRLLVLNLFGFVVNAYTDDAYFDFELFHATAVKAQRLMDDLVDLELEKVDLILEKLRNDPESEELKKDEISLWEDIRQAAENGRRTGLGITALGDTIAALGLRYGTEEATAKVEEIYKALAVGSYTSSVILADERGAFPVCDVEMERGHEYLTQVLEALPQEIQDLYWKVGRRNIANLTTAPTGSVSILTQTTNGIEPAFALSYMRRKKVNPGDANVRVDFTDGSGDCWQHFQVLHHGFAKWCEAQGRPLEEVLDRMASGDMSDVEASPYHKALANDLDWEQRVEAQGRAQRWVDHAISSTVNLPEDVSRETVHEIYMRAWKSGCKGITIYRQGCRTGVLVQEESQPEGEIYVTEAPKRSEDLPCKIHRAKVKFRGVYTNWIFMIGLLGDKPYEVFGGLVNEVEVPDSVEEGVLRKRSFKAGGKYDLVFENEGEEHKIKDVVREFDNPDQGIFTRIVSGALRHGMPVHYLVDQLSKEQDADLHTFAKGLGRVLKQYIPDGTQGKKAPCPQCQSEGTLVYQEGCLTCSLCGYSKCG